MRTQRGLYLHSWWGESGIAGGIAVSKPDEFDERARAEGLLAGEFVATVMPFREPPPARNRLGGSCG